MARILKAINEISAVDRPAQAHARMTIMKRAEEAIDMSNVNVGKLALTVLNGLATALQNERPELSFEAAFAKIYSDPANAEIAKIERSANRPGYPAMARTAPKILEGDGLDFDDVKALVDEERRKHPFLTGEQAYARLYDSPPEHMNREAFRAAMRRAAAAGSEVLGPADVSTVALAKRDVATDELWLKADELRKVQPTLTREAAFAKAFKLNPALAARERSASREALFA
jgi:hypothetical protein